jgi:TPP-dependent 2-oxoacid decarboxylase
MASSWTVGRYLVDRVREVGVRHVFGVPGDYVLGLMDDFVASPVKLVGTCNELNAGYAADAYARVNKVGAVCVTYAVGGFSLLNAVAGAFAERVPVIVICGAPQRGDANEHKLLHHTLGEYGIQVDVFRHVTAAAVSLTSAEEAPKQIDAAIVACLRYRRPVFIEVPGDLVAKPCAAPAPLDPSQRPESDPDALAEAVAEAAALLSAADHPVVLGGIEVHRFGLTRELQALLDESGYPIATTLMDKSVIRETLPQFVGLYMGALSEEYVRRSVEDADCVLALGAWMTDINLGIYTAKIDTGKLIDAGAERVKIKHHHFDRVFLGDFMDELRKALAQRKAKGPPGDGAEKPKPAAIRPAMRSLLPVFEARPEAPITIERFFERVNHFLDEESIVLADAGDSFLCAGSLIMHESVGFLCQAFYCSIGFTIPGALGVGLAAPDRRAVVFVGDGAFQMTAQELSTIVRQGLAPVIFVMNNGGYTVERVIHDGPYNNIQNWRYHLLPQMFGGGWSREVRTEGDLEDALAQAEARRGELAVIEVHLDPKDCSAALKRLGAALSAARAYSQER